MNLKFCLRDGNCRQWSSWIMKTCRVPKCVKEVEVYIKLETPDVVLKAGCRSPYTLWPMRA